MNRSFPFFSIIIPTLNSSKTIGECLNSILNQSCQDFEVLILDGNSSDDTVAIVKNKFELSASKFFLSIKPDIGVYDAMNQGIGLSSGKWLYFLGSDDWLYDNNVLQSVLDQIVNTNINVAYGNVLIHGDSDWAKDKELYAGEFDTLRLTKKNICHQSIFYRNSFLKSNKFLFDLAYPINSDWDFNLKCRVKTEFHYLNTIIANFSSGGLSSYSKMNDHIFKDIPIKYPDLFPSKLRVLTSKIKKSLFK